MVSPGEGSQALGRTNFLLAYGDCGLVMGPWMAIPEGSSVPVPAIVLEMCLSPMVTRAVPVISKEGTPCGQGPAAPAP